MATVLRQGIERLCSAAKQCRRPKWSLTTFRSLSLADFSLQCGWPEKQLQLGPSRPKSTSMNCSSSVNIRGIIFFRSPTPTPPQIYLSGLYSHGETPQMTCVIRLKDHQMEYAESPSTLWNICQQSLLRHGELHNNLRMTWGKAVPLWTESLEHSLFIGQTLNDKYALDGRDPSSVVGIQWCHGLFDRPFFLRCP